jgi:aminopeptidase YwaD
VIPPRCAARGPGGWLAAGALLFACAAPRTAPPPAAPVQFEPARIARDLAWLADDAREGRGVGTPGVAAAAAYLAEGFREAGLSPGGDDGSFIQRFEMPVEIRVSKASLSLRAAPLARGSDFEPFLSSGDGAASGEPVFAGYGISAPELGYDDYEKLDVAGRIVLVLDDRPTGEKSPLRGPQATELLRRAFKIASARARGATALLVAPSGPPGPGDPPLPGNAGRDWANPTQQSSALPVIALSWEAASRIVAAAGGPGLAARKHRIDSDGKPASASLPGAEVALEVAVERRRGMEANVVAILPGRDPELKRQAVVVGAHYDHLGRGEFGSLAPDRRGEIHNGADDNASGAAGLLELARAFAAQPRTRRSLVLVAFSGEEAGLAGSREYAAAPPIPMASTVAMVNLDMIGRLREGGLYIFGTETSPDFPKLVRRGADAARIGVNLSQGAFSPSDQTSFLAQGVPVLFFFTGTHGAYHTPDDDAAETNSEGEADVLQVVYETVRELADADARPTLIAVPERDLGDVGPGYGPYLGTIPDFGGKPGEGVLLQGVRKGSPAEAAGLRAGDRIVEFDGVAVANLEEYAALLFGAHTGQRVMIVAERDGERIAVEATLGQRR